MTTKELIKQLQTEDPSGNLQVVVGGTPIYVIEQVEGYYDGHYGELIQDPLREGYNIIGYKIRKDGRKIKLHLVDLDSVLCENPEAKVELVGIPDYDIKRHNNMINKKRKEYRKMNKEVEEEMAQKKQLKNKKP